MAQSQTLAEFNSSQFASRIDQLNTLLQTFQTLLESEANTLKTVSVNELIPISESKQLLTEQIEQSVLQLNKTLPADIKCHHFFELVDHPLFLSLPASIQTKINLARSLSQTCHDLNLANGMAIQILSNINQVSLQILTGQTQTDSKLYGASGATTQSKSQSSLGKA